MPSLINLPTELLDAIFSQDLALSDHIHITQTCRRFCDIDSRRVFSGITLPSHHAQSLSDLESALSNSQRLRNSILALCFCGNQSHPHWSRRLNKESSEDVVLVDDTTEYAQDFLRVMRMLPRVERMLLVEGFPKWLPGPGEGSEFAKVKTLTLNGRLDVEKVVQWYLKPNLEQLTVKELVTSPKGGHQTHGKDLVIDALQNANGGPKASLRSLTIHFAFGDQHSDALGFIELLRVSNQVETFTWGLTSSSARFIPAKCAPALKCFGSTLKKLVVGVSGRQVQCPDHGKVQAMSMRDSLELDKSLLDLSFFERLETLVIGAIMLLPHKIHAETNHGVGKSVCKRLPRTLKKLGVSLESNTRWSLESGSSSAKGIAAQLEWIRDIMNYKATLLPRLNLIHLDEGLTHGRVPRTLASLASLEPTLAEAMVSFRYGSDWDQS